MRESTATLSRALPRIARLHQLVRLSVGPTATALVTLDLAGRRYRVVVACRRGAQERAAVVIDPSVRAHTRMLLLSEARRALRLRGLQAGHEGRRLDALWWQELAERV